MIVNTAGGMAGGDRFDARCRGRAQARGSSSPPRRPRRSIARSGRTPTVEVKLDGRGRRGARLAAAGDDPVRPRAARRARSRSISPTMRACAGRGGGVRPLRHGRGGRGGRAARPLARAARRPAHSCRERAARRRDCGEARAAGGRRTAASRSRPCWSCPATTRRLRRCARSATVPRRGRRIGLERHCGGAAVRRRRRGAAPRSRQRAVGAARGAALPRLWLN